MKKHLLLGLAILFVSSYIACAVPMDAVNRCHALLYATQENDISRVRSLLQQGTDVNCLSPKDNTPLNIASYQGHLEMVKLLLDFHADVNIPNSLGQTPLYKAVSFGYTQVVTELLKVKDIDINAADHDGVTPLFIASFEGHVDIVEKLLHRDTIQVNRLVDKGYSPLDVAENDVIKSMLIEKGAIAFSPIIEMMKLLVRSVNQGDGTAVTSFIAESRPDLRRALQAMIKEGYTYTFDPYPMHTHVEIVHPHKVKISGVCSAESSSTSKLLASNVKLTGVHAYFVVEHIDNAWVITDTDFAQQLSGSHIWWWLILLIGLLLFWLWMLVDCFNRRIETRGRWFIFLLMFNIIAACIYFLRFKLKLVVKKEA